MGKKVKYSCDYCGKDFKYHNGVVSGHYHYNPAGLDRSEEKNHIKIIDEEGNKPDLCKPCFKKALKRMLG